MDAFRYYVNKWYKNRIQLGSIFYCQIHVTRRCQNNCLHCYFRELNSLELDMPLSKLLALLDNIRLRADALGTIPRVDFTGGDPLLYPNIVEAVRYCQSLNIQYGFKCNPESIISADDAISTILHNSSGVSLSLDGLPSVHDFFRGKGSFDRTLQAIEIIKSGGIQLRVNTTISRKNINNLIPLVDFLVGEKIVIDDYTWARYWSLENSKQIINAVELQQIFKEMTSYMQELFCMRSFYYHTEDGRTLPQIMFGFKEHQWYPFLVVNGYIDYDIQKMVSSFHNCINCTATKHFYIIDPDLSIYKCRKLPETKIDFANFGSTIACVYYGNTELECIKCRHYNGCGGCSAIAKCFTGNINDCEPNCPYQSI